MQIIITLGYAIIIMILLLFSQATERKLD